MDAAIAASVVAVAGTLGGVVAGAGLDWARSARAERRAAAGRRDELYVSLMEASTGLRAGLGKLNALQAAAGRGVPVGEGGTAAAEAVMEEMLGEIRAAVSEAAGLMRELVLASVRLSLTGDESVRRAAAHLAEVAGGVMAYFAGFVADFAGFVADPASEDAGLDHAEAMTAAAEELAQAREVATASWWRRRRLRRELAAARDRTPAPDAT